MHTQYKFWGHLKYCQLSALRNRCINRYIAKPMQLQHWLLSCFSVCESHRMYMTRILSCNEYIHASLNSSCSRKFLSSSPSSSSSIPEEESDSTLHSSAINKCALESEQEEDRQTDVKETIDNENELNSKSRSECTIRTLQEVCEDDDMSKHNDAHIDIVANNNIQKKNYNALEDTNINSSTKDKSNKEHDKDNDDDDDDDEEEGKIHIYKPECTAEEHERKQKTRLFLTILLTSHDFQECKDMLVAALRRQTFKEHHLLALLRDVRSTRFDNVATVTCEQNNDHIERNNEPCSHNGKMNKTKSTCINNNNSDTYTIPHTTATDRLRRVRDIIQFTCEEGYEAGCENSFRPEGNTIHTLLTQLLKAATVNASNSDYNNNNNNKKHNDGNYVTMCNNDNERNNDKQVKKADYAAAVKTKIDDSNSNNNSISDKADFESFQTFGNTKNLLPISHCEESNTHCKKELVQTQSEYGAKGITFNKSISNEVNNDNSNLIDNEGESYNNNNNDDSNYKYTTLMSTDSLPIISASEVWSFLAWMERHDYHVMSDAVLDALELIIDSDEHTHTNTSSSTSSFSSSVNKHHGASVAPKQYAMISRRIHRLEYLNQEREYLKENKNDSVKKKFTRPQSRYHERDQPRPEPKYHNEQKEKEEQVN